MSRVAELVLGQFIFLEWQVIEYQCLASPVKAANYSSGAAAHLHSDLDIL